MFHAKSSISPCSDGPRKAKSLSALGQRIEIKASFTIQLLFAFTVVLCVALFQSAAVATNDRPDNKLIKRQYDSINQRANYLLTIVGPQYADQTNPKFKSYDALGIAATQVCNDPHISAYMSSLLDYDTPRIDNSVPPDIFSLPPLVRYLYQFGKCFSPQQLQHISDQLGKTLDIFGHGTINQAIIQSSSLYLLAQYFPDVVWKDNKGGQYSSHEVMATLTTLLIKRCKSFLRDGQYEQLAPTYTMLNYFPLLNIIDFAHDPELRTAAEASAIILIAMMRADSFHGQLVPPLMRHNHWQRNASAKLPRQDNSVGQQILWLYFGEPISWIYDIQNRAEPVYAIILALSKWRPPSEVLNMYNSGLQLDQISTVTPRFSIWGAPTKAESFGSGAISNDFAIGLGVTEFDPFGYNEDTDLFGIFFKSLSEFNIVDCYHPYWRSNAGEVAWLSDRSSPFMQGNLSADRGVLLFDIPDQDPWPTNDTNRNYKLRGDHNGRLLKTVLCRFPKTIDEALINEHEVVLRGGTVFIGLRFLKGMVTEVKPHDIAATIFRSISVSESKTAIYFRVAHADTGMDIESFRKRLSEDVVRYSPERDVVDYKDSDGRTVSVEFRLQETGERTWISAIPEVLINGKRFERNKTHYIAARGMSTDSSGVVISSPIGDLRVAFAGLRFTVEHRRLDLQ